jgi:Uma2 family endonuclease
MSASITPPRLRLLTGLTAESFAELPGHPHAELVRGAVVEMPPPGFEHGVICSQCVIALGLYLKERPLGRVTCNDAGVITTRRPDTVRGPDIAFYSYLRLPKGQSPTAYPDVTPDLVFEIKSPGNRWSELQAKAAEYLQAGVLVVILIDQEEGRAELHRGNAAVEQVDATGTVQIPEVLPGFSVPLAELLGT